jgi:hypothetical protein
VEAFAVEVAAVGADEQAAANVSFPASSKRLEANGQVTGAQT